MHKQLMRIGAKIMRHLQLLAVVIVVLQLGLLSSSSNGNSGSHVLRFFVHVIRVQYGDETVSSVPFVGVPAASGTNFTLGYPSAFDNRITAARDYNSQEIGRSQGFFIITSLNGRNSTISITLNFYKFDGYIYVGGRFDFSAEVNELLVVGGTDYFANIEGIFRVELVDRFGPNLANSLLYGEVYYHHD